ncbi:hypothetical protein FKP32DRAFT_1593466 [Trametes sanguinea]|nr:hypothetical protein FKP32DRAFT_1593466 [Trametes sanguinea]
MHWPYTRPETQVRHSPRLASQSSDPPVPTPQPLVEGAVNESHQRKRPKTGSTLSKYLRQYCEVRKSKHSSQKGRARTNDDDGAAGHRASSSPAEGAGTTDLQTTAAALDDGRRLPFQRPLHKPHDPTTRVPMTVTAARATVPSGSRMGCIAPLQTIIGLAPAPAQVRSILDTLLAYALPRDDAARIAQLLSSLGIGDIRYLRVLAGLRSRDAWLQELKVKGQLSEIELRVLQEILNGLVRGAA